MVLRHVTLGMGPNRVRRAMKYPVSAKIRVARFTVAFTINLLENVLSVYLLFAF